VTLANIGERTRTGMKLGTVPSAYRKVSSIAAKVASGKMRAQDQCSRLRSDLPYIEQRLGKISKREKAAQAPVLEAELAIRQAQAVR
jgi:hypothetical protein